MPEIRKLKNGTTLVLCEDKTTEAVSLIVYIGAGSRYENKKIVGMTHFLEHLLFDGTERRPTSLDISKEIDSLGAEVNAHPSEEYTNFHIKCAAEHLEKAADIFSYMLLHSRLTDEDIEKEKKVVLEEIKMRTDIPSSHIFNVFDQAIFAGNPLGRYTGGEPETIRNIARRDVQEFYQKYYLASNIYISVCGSFAGKTADQITELIESKFTFASGDASLTKNLDIKQKKLNFQVKNSQQTNIVMGYYGCAYNSPDRIGLKLLSVILGGNMSSRLFTEIREKKGLAYDVRTYSFSISDIGTFQTIAGVADEKAGEVLELILNQHRLIKSGVDEDELTNAKSYLLGQLKIGLEDSNELGELFLSQVFYTGKTETLSEIAKKIAKIKTEDLKLLANKYFENSKLSVAVIAKEEVKPEIEKAINNLG